MSQIKQPGINRFVQAVTAVEIQGAAAVAEATLNALVHFLVKAGAPSSPASWRRFEKLAGELSNLRPTEPMARNLSAWLVFELKKRYRQAGGGPIRWSEQVHRLGEESRYFLKEISAQVSEAGSKLVRSKQTIFTHCHSSLAEGILLRAKQQRKKFKVYHTETRPLFQGRLTSRRLKAAHIQATMVADSAAAWLISNHSGDDVSIDWVLLGADSIGTDGSVVNKIGSFAIALSAYDSGIPLYVAATLLKLDAKGESQIEVRPRDELWPGAPKGTSIVNYAFDRVPAEYITAYVTEVGLVKPKDVIKAARKQYSWLT